MQLSKPSQAKIPLPIPTHPLLPYRRRHPGARPNSFRIHPTSLPRIPKPRIDVLGLPLTEHWRKPDTVPGEALCPPLKPDAVPPPPRRGPCVCRAAHLGLHPPMLPDHPAPTHVGSAG